MITVKNRRKKLIFFIWAILILAGLRYAYKFTPYRLEFLGHYDKVWTHRVNSLEKQEAALLFHKGIEVDLDYIEELDFLDINHLPAPSIGLSFEEYVHNIPNKKGYPYLWLDIKELDTLNNQRIFNKIAPVLRCKKYPLEKVLVEGMQPEALEIFKKEGFKVTYYLPWYLHDLSESELLSEINTLKNMEKRFPQTAFSTNTSQYELIKKHFPDKELYLWAEGHRPVKDFFLFRKILKDTLVIAVLSPYRSYKGGNR